MKIKIGSTTYTKIEDLKFDPSADITGTSVEINQFSASIKTTDSISFGDYAYLYDDSDNLWAKYWITEVEAVNDGFLDIIAQSFILLLDRITLPAKMYTGAAVSDVLTDIFSSAPKAAYSLDPSFTSQTISGFCKEQTARERFQWVCFVIGAYVKTYFTDKIEILPVLETETAVPINKTYYKPSITYGDFVTAVKITAYTYEVGDPKTTDTYVTPDNETYYIQTTQTFTLKNAEVPETAAENVIEVSDVTIVTPENVSAILSRLSKYYFKRIEASAEVIDNGEYQPAQKLLINVNTKGRMVSGYATDFSFSFGHSQKATIKLMQTDNVSGVKLSITYTGNGQTIGSAVYYYPAGYEYEIENPYFDVMQGADRYVFIPDNEYAKGTMGKSDTNITENESPALRYTDFTNGRKLLYVFSVDEVKESEVSETDDSGVEHKGLELTIS